MEKIGLIAGNGTFPVAFAREAKRRGYSVVAVAHSGESRPEIDGVADSVEWIRVGQIGRMIRTFARAGVRRAVMAGGIDKARSLTRVRPDRRGLRLLGRALSKGDDALLRGLAAELEGEGIEIVPCTTFLEKLLFPAGVLAGKALDDRAARDLRLGVEVLRALGPLDVGQSVVVEDGVVGDVRHQRPGVGRAGGVVVDEDRTAGRLEQPGDHLQQGRLPGAVVAHERDRLPAGDAGAERVQGDEVAVVLLDVVEIDGHEVSPSCAGAPGRMPARSACLRHQALMSSR